MHATFGCTICVLEFETELEEIGHAIDLHTHIVASALFFQWSLLIPPDIYYVGDDVNPDVSIHVNPTAHPSPNNFRRTCPKCPLSFNRLATLTHHLLSAHHIVVDLPPVAPANPADTLLTHGFGYDAEVGILVCLHGERGVIGSQVYKHMQSCLAHGDWKDASLASAINSYTYSLEDAPLELELKRRIKGIKLIPGYRCQFCGFGIHQLQGKGAPDRPLKKHCKDVHDNKGSRIDPCTLQMWYEGSNSSCRINTQPEAKCWKNVIVPDVVEESVAIDTEIASRQLGMLHSLVLPRPPPDPNVIKDQRRVGGTINRLNLRTFANVSKMRSHFSLLLASQGTFLEGVDLARMSKQWVESVEAAAISVDPTPSSYRGLILG